MTTEYTLDTLKTTLSSWIQDKSPEFNTALDDIIRRGEDALVSDLKLNIYGVERTMTLNGRFATSPAALISERSMWYTSPTTGRRVYILPRTVDYVMDYAADVASSLVPDALPEPLYRAQYGEDQYVFAPATTAPLDITILGVERYKSLTELPSGSKTWTSRNTGDLLVLSCLIQAERFIMDDERVNAFKAEYKEKLPAAMELFDQKRRKDY